MADTPFEVKIDSLAYNGYGVGRVGGKVVFVPLTAPGDVVECRIVREKKQFLFGEMVRLVIPSCQRRQPPCPVFGECGGCHWQHLPCDLQVDWKERIFRQMLQRSAGPGEEVFAAAAASPREWGYRSRVQFKCRLGGQRFVAGFYRRQSHFVIDIDSCPLADPKINAALQRYRRLISDSPYASHIPQIDISADEEGRVRVVIHHLHANDAGLADHLLPEAVESRDSLCFQTGRNHTLRHLHGESRLFTYPMGFGKSPRLGYGAGSFSQVNAEHNRRLVGELLEMADLTGKERVLDLFCGIGNLSLPLALQAGEVVGVESYPDAVTMARRNAAENRIGNARFVLGDANGLLADLAGFDVAVLDPPREGAFAAVKGLIRHRPRKILYVSCNPATLARDLVPLVHGGYEVVRARAYDFFPQTFHIEGLVCLQRKNNFS
ncbi:MAG: class I SAM-dependent RNA methyltransferase [Desulfuromonadaceae bacterium]|nr:class I SAM-dependent RNA methyltransferase [Desulfuromonadaceae bacterium]